MNLNGWQRLWVFISVLALLFTIAMIVDRYDKNIEDDEWLYITQNIGNEYKQMFVGIGQSGEDISMFLDKHSYKNIVMTNGDSIIINKILSDADIKILRNRYAKVLEQMPINKNIKMAAVFLFSWLLFCLVTYIAGYSIGWIYSGFKQ